MNPQERAAESYKDEHDQMRVVYRGLTQAQLAAVHASTHTVLVEGGNQAGKTICACWDCIAYALGIHPVAKWWKWLPKNQVPAIWYSTTTYERFHEQAWLHFQRLLLFPGETVHNLPTTRIKAISWGSYRKIAPNGPLPISGS